MGLSRQHIMCAKTPKVIPSILNQSMMSCRPLEELGTQNSLWRLATNEKLLFNGVALSGVKTSRTVDIATVVSTTVKNTKEMNGPRRKFVRR